VVAVSISSYYAKSIFPADSSQVFPSAVVDGAQVNYQAVNPDVTPGVVHIDAAIRTIPAGETIQIKILVPPGVTSAGIYATTGIANNLNYVAFGIDAPYNANDYIGSTVRSGSPLSAPLFFSATPTPASQYVYFGIRNSDTLDVFFYFIQTSFTVTDSSLYNAWILAGRP
jgi:hypothetical protein